jgi:hypothetical protein
MRKQMTVSILASTLLFGSTLAAAQGEPAGVDFTKTTCEELAQQSDEDRAFGLIFYYGYLAGRANATTIDNARVSDQLLRVREYCAGNPQSTVIDAFAAALK